MLAEALANRLENLPGLKLLVKRTETVGRHAGCAGRGHRSRNRRCPCRRADSASPSNAGRQGPDADAPGHPGVRPASDTIYLTWHMPAGSYDRIEPDIRAHAPVARASITSPEPSYRKQ